MNQKKVGAHILVSGMVQGVGYRFFVTRKAAQYNLKGFVRNLYTEDVEVEVEGEQGLITDFIKELRTGPSFARVTNISVDWKEYEGKYKNFDVRF